LTTVKWYIISRAPVYLSVCVYVRRQLSKALMHEVHFHTSGISQWDTAQVRIWRSSGQCQGHWSKKVTNTCSCIDQHQLAIFIGTRQMAPETMRCRWSHLRLEGMLVKNINGVQTHCWWRKETLPVSIPLLPELALNWLEEAHTSFACKTDGQTQYKCWKSTAAIKYHSNI